MKNTIVILMLGLLFLGCSNMEVAQLDPRTKRFETDTKATLVKSIDIDLDQHKSLLLLPDDEFMKGQMRNIKYFDKMITFEELETIIIKNNLTENIPALNSKIAISRAAKAYKPFLWLRLNIRNGSGYNQQYAQFLLINAETSEELLVVERHLDYIWAGVNDQNTWYPLFNAIVDYIDKNSKTWSK